MVHGKVGRGERLLCLVIGLLGCVTGFRLAPPLRQRLFSMKAATATNPVVPHAKFPSYYWDWRGHKIRYQAEGDTGPALLLVHGFGGNCEHWRRNVGDLSKFARVYVIDLLGYGYSDKPSPKEAGEPNTLYNFDTWADQLGDFVNEIVGSPAYAICNSVGGIAALNLAVKRPEAVKGLALFDISLRMLHVKKQAWWARPFVPILQTVLRETSLGEVFFSQVATHKGVKNVLDQAYGDPNEVTDELVNAILQPGLLPGAVDVFLDFISYSGGPLPEELLPKVKQPVLFGWGEADPWEPIDMGRELYAGFPCVKEFVPLKGVGHCPQDEAPQLVNPLVRRFVEEVEATTA